jgi:hypothetical protein
MMEDERVAKAFLSAIIEEEVIELDFAAQERTIFQSKQIEGGEVRNGELYLTVCRFDFSAKIALPDGSYKVVMIELQKAQLPADIMRFRRYLGLHYQNSNNTYNDGDVKKARQIYCIFLLGYDVGIPGRPIIQVDNAVRDGITKELLSETSEFIEGLNHRSWIVQIDQLKQRRRNDIETLLSVFDQKNRTEKDLHIIDINEDNFPENFRPLIRRLRMASESEEIRNQMQMEDEYMQYFQEQEERLNKKEKALAEKEKVLEEEKQAFEIWKRQLSEKQND